MALYTIKNLSFTYPNQEMRALENLNFTIESGEILLVCGKSGCGKTTLLRHLKTTLAPFGKTEGEVLFHEKPLKEAGEREQASQIGYVWQSPEHQIVTDKVWHELAFGLENLGYPQEVIRLRVAEMASYFGIEQWFYKSVEELSGGQKQLLNLASVMAMQPEVLILDEPTSQLDPIAAGEFLATIRKINQEFGTTIILIEQRLDEVFAMADRVLVLEQGKVLAWDTPETVGKSLTGHDLFAAMPIPMQIYEQSGGKGACPLTVREGRSWLKEQYPDVRETSILELEQSENNKIRRNTISEKNVSGKRDRTLKEIVIGAKELWFRYEKNSPDVIRGLSFEVEKGEIFCLLGGNGVGKSTALSLINGVRRPYRGKIRINGKELTGYKKKELFTNCLGTLPQNPQTLFVRDTVKEDLEEMFRGKLSESDEELLKKVIEETQIAHLLSMHPYDLSGGEQQRAALAKVLLLEPQILILDEPTKGLDGFYKKSFGEMLLRLKNQGITILMVSHDIEFCASYGDTCALFFDGNIVTKQPAHQFFAGNSFYTTVANRMSRGIFGDAVTMEDVVKLCRVNQELQEERN